MEIRTDADQQSVNALIQRASFYRVAVPRAAVVAGIMSILAAAAISFAPRILERQVRPREFAFVWIAVFLLALAIKSWLSREKASEPIVCEGKKVIRRAILPNLVIPLMFTGWFITTGYLGAQELNLVVVWVAFYGLTLLSTSLFGPRSLVVLGWAFLLTSLAVPALIEVLDRYFSVNIPNFLMATTFGVYHLIYAACAWQRKA